MSGEIKGSDNPLTYGPDDRLSMAETQMVLAAVRYVAGEPVQLERHGLRAGRPQEVARQVLQLLDGAPLKS